MDVVIRASRPEDAAAVVALVHALAHHHEEAPPPFGVEDFHKEGFGPEAGFSCLVAERESRLLGFAAFTRAYVLEWAQRGGFLLALYVEDAARGEGIGKALVAETCRVVQARGARFLAWNTIGGNEEAEAFYRRLGAETHDLKSWSATGEAFTKLAES